MSGDEALVKARRSLIAERALTLFLEQGFHRTQVREIARACGLSSGTLYHYIGTKDDIAVILADQMNDEILEFVNSSVDTRCAAECLRSVLERWYNLCDRLQESVIFLYRETGNFSVEVQDQIKDIDERCVAMFEMIIANGIRNGEFQINDARLAATDLYMGGHIWALRRWALTRRHSLHQYTTLQIELFLKALASGQRPGAVPKDAGVIPIRPQV